MSNFFEEVLKDKDLKKALKDEFIKVNSNEILLGNKIQFSIKDRYNEIDYNNINNLVNIKMSSYNLSFCINKGVQYFHLDCDDNSLKFRLPINMNIYINFRDKNIKLKCDDREKTILCKYLEDFSIGHTYMDYSNLKRTKEKDSIEVFNKKLPLKYSDEKHKLYLTDKLSDKVSFKMINNNDYQEYVADEKKFIYKTNAYVCTNNDKYVFYGLNNNKFDYGILVSTSNVRKEFYKIQNKNQSIIVYDDGMVNVYNNNKLVFSLDYEMLRDFILDVNKGDINKVTELTFNINNNIGKDFDAEKELESLIGLKNVKNQITRFKKYCINAIENGNPINLHMVFSGNPGTGKTTVARLVAKILYKYKILPKDVFVECSKETLVAQYIGQTALKTLDMVNLAMGGVLFIDEAYSLTPTGGNGFEGEALATLIKAMEDNKGKFCVILAGYSKEMNELFNANSGLKSRVQKDVHFEDYTKDELRLIFESNLRKVGYTISNKAKDMIIDYIESKREDKSFSNARELRIATEQLCMIQSERTVNDLEDYEISDNDVNVFLTENASNNKSLSLPTCEMIDYDKIIEYSKESRDLIKKGGEVLEAVLSLSATTPEGIYDSSGFIISPDGYAVTNAHCIKDASKLVARRRIIDRNDNWVDTYHNCLLAAVDNERDLAIIKLESRYDNDFSYLPLAIDISLNHFNEVVEIGYPLGATKFDNVSIYQGYISSIQFIRGSSMYVTDVFACLGLSGSCLLDKSTGKVVGVHSATYIQNNYKFNLSIRIGYLLNLIKRNN